MIDKIKEWIDVISIIKETKVTLEKDIINRLVFLSTNNPNVFICKIHVMETHLQNINLYDFYKVEYESIWHGNTYRYEARLKSP